MLQEDFDEGIGDGCGAVGVAVSDGNLDDLGLADALDGVAILISAAPCAP